MGFMIGQRPFIKMYLLKMIDERKYYGLEMMEEMKIRLKTEGYSPPQSELYRALNELLRDGIIYGSRQIKGDHDATGDFQEIILYQFTDDGRERAETLKIKLKLELDRSLGMLKMALKDNF